MPQKKIPTLGRRLVGNLAVTFAAVALVFAALTIVTLYLNFQRTMEHETTEALTHLSQEIQDLSDDMFFHSDTLALVVGWKNSAEPPGVLPEDAEELEAHLRNWFVLAGVDIVGTAPPAEWEVLGYDLSVFPDQEWEHPQVALHSRKLGEMEILVAVPGVGAESGSLMLTSRKLDDNWMRITSRAIVADIGICDVQGRLLASSFSTPPKSVSLGNEELNLIEVGDVEYGYNTRRSHLGNRFSIYLVAFVSTAEQKGLGYRLGFILFFGMAVAFPLLFWINRVVMGRAIADMQTLVGWANNYRRSPDTQPPPEGKFQETQVLSRGFGVLVARLDSAFSEIEQQNRSLELVVGERTAELREQHLLLDAILSELPSAVVLLDAHYGVSYANPKAQEAFGISGGEPLPAPLRPGENGEYQGQLTNFKGRNYILGVTRLKDPVRVVLVATDVTDRQAIEEQLLQSQKLESVGRLAGGVAHEFNNALASIIPCVEMLRITVQNERAMGYIDSIENAATKGAEVVRQLLTFSRTGNYSRQPLDINVVIDNTVKMLKPTAKQVQIKWRPRLAMPKIKGSEPLLQQLLLNLSLNALDAMGGVGTIEFEAWTDPEGARVFFSVADSGPGIPADVAEHIFDPFFSTKSQEEGTGLGLAVAYGVVERHGGKIRLVSTEGEGAKFEIEIPVWVGSEEGEEDPPSSGSADEIVIGG